MNNYILWVKIKTRPLGLHRLRGRDGFVMAAMILLVGMPLSWVGEALTSDTGNFAASVISHFPQTNENIIAWGAVILYSLFIWLAMRIGRHILLRHLS